MMRHRGGNNSYKRAQMIKVAGFGVAAVFVVLIILWTRSSPHGTDPELVGGAKQDVHHQPEKINAEHQKGLPPQDDGQQIPVDEPESEEERELRKRPLPPKPLFFDNEQREFLDAKGNWWRARPHLEVANPMFPGCPSIDKLTECDPNVALIRPKHPAPSAAARFPGDTDVVKDSTAGTTGHFVAGDEGFHFPFFMYVPPVFTDPRTQEYRPRRTRILVVPNNAPPDSDKEKMAAYDVTTYRFLAAELGMVLVVPVFPRYHRPAAYTHALDGETIQDKWPDDLPVPDGHARMDLQLLAMVEKVKELLTEQPYNFDPAKIYNKIVMIGFSASAMFSNRMAALHPHKIRAVVVGTQTLLIPPPPPKREGASKEEESMLSIHNYEQDYLFPVGVADMKRYTTKPFDDEDYKKIAFHFFVGDADKDDILALLEPHVAKETSKRIWERFGFQQPMTRFERVRDIYHASGIIKSQFVVYPGDVHEFTTRQKAAVVDFLRDELMLDVLSSPEGEGEGVVDVDETSLDKELPCPAVATHMCI